ncbi:MAG: acylphosphatase [Candidatus Omnitrophota bacterium]|nr:acylphosphatase [Candidatus Omnitrophota bacterium]
MFSFEGIGTRTDEIQVMDQIQRLHIVYSGQVQGVGFRFVAERIALQLGLTGFVKNLSNGNVEVVCEGSRQQLETFLREIGENLYGYIGDSHIEWENARDEFRSFEIRF